MNPLAHLIIVFFLTLSLVFYAIPQLWRLAGSRECDWVIFGIACDITFLIWDGDAVLPSMAIAFNVVQLWERYRYSRPFRWVGPVLQIVFNLALILLVWLSA